MNCANNEKVPPPGRKRLSVCMIVKNEEKHLANCLRSVQSIADEIVVVDTGSTDKTITIARQFNAETHHFRWCDDFAAARNFARSKATGTWILQIDADEELLLEDEAEIKKLLEQQEIDIFFVAIHNKSSSVFGDNQPVIHFLPRLFRNRPELIYENPVHENLRLQGKYKLANIKLLHHGYNMDEEFLAEKRARNARILLEKLSENPQDAKINFYLSQHYLYNKDYVAAKKHAECVCRGFEQSIGRNKIFYLMALNNLAAVALEEQNDAEVQRICHKAQSCDAMYIMPLFYSAVSYYREEQFELSKKTFLEFLSKHEQLNRAESLKFYDFSANAYLFQVYHLLGKIYRKEGYAELALDAFSRAVALHPTFWIGFADIGYLFAQKRDWHKALSYFEKAFTLAKESPAVTPANSVLWKDFESLCKTYMRILKQFESDSYQIQ